MTQHLPSIQELINKNMIDNINYQLNQKNEYQQGESSSHRLLLAVEDFLKQNSRRKIFQSKSLDDLQLHEQYQQTNNNHVSNTTRTEMDLSGIGCDNHIKMNEDHLYSHHEDDLKPQRSQSAPVSPTKFYDQELIAFIQNEQQQQQQELIPDSFAYDIDLSDTNHQPHSRTAIFFDDDYAPDDISYKPPLSVNIIHSSLINSCLTITEENEEELEQLKRDDDEEKFNKENHLFKINDGTIPTITLFDNDDRADLLENDQQIKNIPLQKIMINQDYDERLSTIYESPSPQPRTEDDNEEEEEQDIYDDAYDKLIVYDVASVNSIEKPSIISSKIESIIHSASSYRSPILDRSRIRSCFTDASFEPCPTFPTTATTIPSASYLCGTTTMINSKVFKPPLTINNNEKSSFSPVFNTETKSINKSIACLPSEQQESPSKSSPMSLSVPMLLLPITTEHSTCMMDNNKIIPSQHIKKMKVIQSSSSSLSDFIIPTPTSTLKSTIHYEEVPSVHHSLTDCSSIHRISCCVPMNDEDSLIINKSTDDNQRRPSFTRRILTNGLLLSHCSNSNPTHRRTQPPLTFNQHRQHIKPKSEEKLSSLSSPIVSSSSSSEGNSPSGDKIMSRSDFILQHQQQNLSQQRKATSLKTISLASNQQSSKIVYPIDFKTNSMDQSWYQKHSLSHHKVPTSDSGIVIDTDGTRLTSKSSIEENDVDGIPIDIANSNKLKQYENNYRKTLTDLAIIKKNIVDIESRLTEAMRELEIERALVEGEHEIVFKEILDASECDQQKIQHLYNDLQLLIERIMAEKNSIRNEIVYTQQTLGKLEHELRQLEEQYRPSDDKILKKKEILAQTRQKHEDLEFQLMELETRCEAELEQAEEHFQNEQILVTQNSKLRQNTLRDLDHQQNLILHEVILEKDKLEREKQKLKLLFKQKKIEAYDLEQKIHGISSANHNQKFNGHSTMYHSTPSNLYSSINYSSPKINTKDNQQEKLNEIKEMIAVAKLEKMTILEEQLRERYNELLQTQECVEFEQNLSNDQDYLIERQVKLREKNRIQERPLTRYLPIRSVDFDLRAHIEGGGHLLNSSHIHITSTSCRGFLLKMGGMKFKTWNRRWFVFDRKRRSLFYYQDKTETKLRGCIYFQSILEVYLDHLQSISLRSPEPRQATFIVKTIERNYYLVAPTVEAMRIWVDVIITGAEGNTFAGES